MNALNDNDQMTSHVDLHKISKILHLSGLNMMAAILNHEQNQEAKLKDCGRKNKNKKKNLIQPASVEHL